jgi:acrylyl-CoA reductase (NADPH)
MADTTFRALVAREGADGTFTKAIVERTIDDLPDHEVLIRVCYSALNYKDALSASGNKGVTRTYPATPGVDAAGVVEASADARFTPRMPVLVTGYDLGMNTSGGLAEYIRVPGDWVVPLPEGLSLAEAMAFGTAGFTAADAIRRIEEGGIAPGDGDVLVTGATGGVGCLAVAILSHLGYRTVAATGKADAHDFLLRLGASKVISREEVARRPDRVLGKPRWAGVVDTVGGEILDIAIRCTQLHGVVSCCGMITSADLHTSVFPFIIRGVTLVGIDSAQSPMSRRELLWSRLAGPWKPTVLDELTTECTLDEVPDRLDQMLAGKSFGHTRVNMSGE